ncbi:MAG: hypothetical protein WC378_08115 [Opitutaceae bacterium]|jgi:hypothetical protein
MPVIQNHTVNAQPKQSPEKKPSSAEVLHILKGCDWDQYWQTVTEKSYKEIEAYRHARAKYLEKASQHVFV